MAAIATVNFKLQPMPEVERSFLLPFESLGAAIAARIRDAVVLERHEQLPVQRVPQPQFRSNVVIEVWQQRLAVATFGRRRQTDEDLRSKMWHQVLIRPRRYVMALVDDNVLEVVRAEAPDELACTLNAREYVFHASGCRPSTSNSPKAAS